MQTTQESNSTAPVLNRAGLTVIVMFVLDNVHSQRSFDLSTHNGRVEMNRFVIWAANRRLDYNVCSL